MKTMRTIYATRFIAKMSNSSSDALLMECNDGEKYVVKHKNNSQSVYGTSILIAEYICYLIVKKLSLNIPEMCLVYIDDMILLTSNDHKIHSLIRSCFGLNIGSKYLGNTTRVLSDRSKLRAINEIHLQIIYGFDQYIYNTDRMESNPNLLLSNDNMEIWVIDHSVTIWPIIERSHDICSPIAYSSSHVLYPFLNHDFREVVRLLESIYNNVIEEYLNSVPTEWFNEDLNYTFLDNFLKKRRDDIRKIIKRSIYG